MKIVFFNYLLLEYGGGLAKYFIDTATGIKERYPDLDITILTFDEKMLQKTLFFYNIYFLGLQDRKIYKEKSGHIKKQLGDVRYVTVSGLKDMQKKLGKFDVIYSSNNLLEVILLKYVIGYKNLPPVIYGLHIPSFYPITKSLQSKLHNLLYSSLIYKFALSGALRLHVMNTFDEERLTKLIPKQEIQKIYHPFDFSYFSHKATISKTKITSKKGTFALLWIGRLTEQKGVFDLIEIIDSMNSSGYQNKIVWNIAGDGELRKDIIKLSKKWSNVHYLGYIENKATANVYQDNDLLLCTSKWESFPYVLLEAQSLGLPVISYNIQGCNDIIVNNKNGYLVKNKEQFINKIIYCINGTPFNRHAIQSFIQNRFNREKLYSAMYQLLMYD